MPGFDLKDYVTVAERVTAFYTKFPDGSLQSEIVELNESRVVMRAYAYRTPTDERPGIGYSSLGIPGTTPYTKNSEIENCESSAWGRAIAALGFEVKRGIASGDEIANKQDDGPPHLPPRQDRNTIDPPAKMGAVTEELIGRVSRRGTIRKGTSKDYQLEARQGPDGHVIGFLQRVENFERPVAAGSDACVAGDCIHQEVSRFKGSTCSHPMAAPLFAIISSASGCHAISL